MSRHFGIVALVIAFAWCGFLGWLFTARPMQTPPPRIPAVANIESVQRDLCSLAVAEVDFHRTAGRYASFHELRSNGKLALPPDSRWPYLYVLHAPTLEEFSITAVSANPTVDSPRLLIVDDQMQVQIRTRPPRVYGCKD
jgi:hypothetical protein